MGRLDDISVAGINLVKDIVQIFKAGDIHTEIIAASIRNPIHVTDCAMAGADIATVPYSVLEAMTKHPLTDAGIEKICERLSGSISRLDLEIYIKNYIRNDRNQGIQTEIERIPLIFLCYGIRVSKGGFKFFDCKLPKAGSVLFRCTNIRKSKKNLV